MKIIKLAVLATIINLLVDGFIAAMDTFGDIVFSEAFLYYALPTMAILAIFVVSAHKLTNAFINRHFF